MNATILVFCAGAVAGAMNALAGGGSFVSLPVLIAVGVPPVQANTSSTVALFPGGLASAWAYRKGLGPVSVVPLCWLVFATLCGGLAGAVLLLHTPAASFTFLLPWLLLIALLALTFGRRLGEALRARCRCGIRPGWVLTAQFMLGIYGGYFGGAVGIMMLAIWGLLDDCDFKRLNAPRTLLVSTANIVAVCIFVLAHAVRWPETLIMLAGAIAGGYGGVRLGRLANPTLIRRMTLLATACITVAYFLKTYWAMALRHWPI